MGRRSLVECYVLDVEWDLVGQRQQRYSHKTSNRSQHQQQHAAINSTTKYSTLQYNSTHTSPCSGYTSTVEYALLPCTARTQQQQYFTAVGPGP